jgi:hypothetical protein
MFRYRLMLAALVLSAAAFAQTAASTPAQTTTPSTTPSAAQSADQPPPPPPTPGGATHVIGFETVKRDAKGTLTVGDGKLHFDKTAIDVSSITDVFSGSESRQVGGAPLTLVKLAAPFGAGRVLSLFAHQQVDNITVEYTDANGGLHGAIFLMPKGRADAFKKELVAAGAHASPAIVPEVPAKTDAKEKK